MKLITYNNNRLGLLMGEKVADIKHALGRTTVLTKNDTMIDLINKFSSIEQHLRTFKEEDATTLAISALSLLPPIPRPGKLICTVDNYLPHAVESTTEVFPKPIFFMKPQNTLIGSGSSVVLPKFAQRVDHELELALIIGKTCHQVSAREALKYIFGYSIILDMSARDFRTIPYSWFSMKGWDTFGPLGPAIVTSDEIGDPHDLEMRLWVNGQLRMHGNTQNMVFKIPELIEAVSEVTTLMPGDIIATGTIEGIAPVFEGDKIVAEIQKLGKLEVAVTRSPHKDSWHAQDFPEYYADFRERDTADKGPDDPMAPRK